MGGADEEVVGAGKTGKRRPLLLIGLGGVLLLAALGGGAVFLLPRHGAAAASKAGADVASVMVDVPDIISNLDTAGHRATFVKMHAKIEVAGAPAAKQVQAGMPRVLDLFQTYLRSMRPDELKGGEGMYRLREALIYRLDGAFAPVEVKDVLFTELLVQ